MRTTGGREVGGGCEVVSDSVDATTPEQINSRARSPRLRFAARSFQAFGLPGHLGEERA